MRGAITKILFAMIISIIGMLGCFSQSVYAEELTGPFIRNEDRDYSVLNRELDRITEWVNEAPDTDLDKILAIYEYMCLNYRYDETYKSDNSLSLVVQKQGICQSFANTFEFFAEYFGITESTVSGGPDDNGAFHVWNVVKIDDKWYSLDATWDGMSETVGYCGFNYFLKSVRNFGHYEYLIDIRNFDDYFERCNNTEFDLYWWSSNNPETPLCQGCTPIPYNGAWYYVNKNYEIVKRSSAAADAEETVIRDCGLHGIQCGRNIAILNDKLYFMGNESESTGQVCYDIYQMSMEVNSQEEKVFTADEAFEYFGLQNKGLYYCKNHAYIDADNVPVEIPEVFSPATDITVSQNVTSYYGDYPETIHFSGEVVPESATYRNVEWAGHSNSIDKNGNWRVHKAGKETIYAYLPESNLYREVTINIPSADLGNLQPMTVHTDDGKDWIYWSKSDTAEKYSIFKIYKYPFHHWNRVRDTSYQWVGETTDNYFEIPEGVDDKFSIYGVLPMSRSGVGIMENTQTWYPSVDAFDNEPYEYPKNLQATQRGDDIILTFDPLEGCDHYMYKYMDVSTGKIEIGYGNYYDNQITVSGLEAGKEYVFFVRALFIENGNEVNPNGTLDYSDCGIASIAVQNHDHSLKRVDAIEPSCATAGNIEYWVCEGCHNKFSDEDGENKITDEEITIPASGHKYGELIEEVPATCTEDGTAAHYECSTCHKLFVKDGNNYDEKTLEEIVLVAAGHSYGELIEEVPATCTEDGTAAHYECSTCHKLFVKDGSNYDEKTFEEIVLAAAGHTFNQRNVEEAYLKKEADCTHPAVYFKSCKCGEKSKETFESGEALGHDYQEEVGTAISATCTADGKKANKKCSRCDDLIEGAVVEKLGHDYKEVEGSAVDATCTKDGKEADQKCSRCDNLIEGAIIEKFGHDFQEVEGSAVTATCTKDGKEADKKCSRCDDLIEGAVIEKLGHDYQEVEGSAVAATCTKDGKEADQKCSRCDDLIEGAVIENFGHDYQVVEGSAAAATCTKDGKESDQKCSRCEEFIEGAVVEKLGHDYQEVEGSSVTATCTKDGKESDQKCSRCHDIKTGKVIGAIGHEWDNGAVTTPPSCETAGVKTFTCKHDGSHQRTENIDPIGHDWGSWEVATPSSCVLEGQEVRTCTHDPNHKEYRKSSKLAHQLTHVNGIAATCEADGVKEYWTCSTCGGIFSNAGGTMQITEADFPVPAIGHAFGDWTPLDEKQHQRICGNDDTHIETADHVWGEGVITKEATVNMNGEKLFTCDVCKATRTETIPATGGEDVDPITPTEETADQATIDKTIPTVNTSKIKTTANIKKKQMQVKFPVSDAADNFRIQYRVAGKNQWTSDWSAGTDNYAIRGLKKSSLCEFRIAGYVKQEDGSWARGEWSKTSYRYMSAVPAKTIKTGKKSLTLSWAKDKKASGYQVQYSLKKNMAGAKTVNVKGASKTKCTIPKLKSGKRYYVKVRPVKKKAGKTYVGILSGVKVVKIK